MSTPGNTRIDTNTNINTSTTARGNLFGNSTMGDSGIRSIATSGLGTMGGFDDEEHNYSLTSDSVSRRGEGNRRVSFGPTARLSFSSIKGDMEFYNDQIESSLANNDYLNDISSNGNYRSQPLKVQRMGTPTSPNDMDEKSHSTVSPIPMTTNTPGFHSTNVNKVSMKHQQISNNDVDDLNDADDLFEDEFETTSDQHYHNTIQLESGLNKGLKIQKSSNIINNNKFKIDDLTIKMKLTGVQNLQELTGKDDNISSELLISGLLSVFSRAYQLLCIFKCKECVNLLHRLPRRHFSSGLVQNLLGIV